MSLAPSRRQLLVAHVHVARDARRRRLAGLVHRLGCPDGPQQQRLLAQAVQARGGQPLADGPRLLQVRATEGGTLRAHLQQLVASLK